MNSQQKIHEILSQVEHTARAEDLSQSLDLFKEAMILAGQIGDGVESFSNQVWRAINPLLDLNRPEIIRSLTASLQRAGSPDFLGDFLITSGGRIGDQTKNYALALEMHQQALGIYEGTGDQLSILRALSSIVFCQNELEEYSQAFDNSQRGLRLAQELESVSYLVKFIESHARILLRTGRFIEASQYLLAAQKDARGNGFNAIAADLGYLAAEVKADAGDYEEAAALAHSVLDEIRLLGSNRQEAQLYTKVGALLMRIENWEAADDILMQAVNLSQYLPVQDQANNLHNYAIVRSNLGHWKEAVKLEEEALQRYQTINYAMGLQLSRSHLKNYRLQAQLENPTEGVPPLQVLHQIGNLNPEPPISSEKEQEHNSAWLDFLHKKQWIEGEPGGTESKITIKTKTPEEIQGETKDILDALVNAAAQYPFNYEGLENIKAAVGLMLDNQPLLKSAAEILHQRSGAGWVGASFRRVYLCSLILGLIHLQLDEPDQALQVLSTAASLSAVNQQIWPEIALRRALSQALQKQMQYTSAILEHKQISQLLALAQRDIAWNDRSRRLFLDANFGFLEEMVEGAYLADEPETALFLLENHRGRAFVESLRAKHIQETASAESLQEMEQLMIEEDKLQDQLINCLLADTVEKDRIRERLQQNQREMEMLILQVLSSAGEINSWTDVKENKFLTDIPEQGQVIYYFVASSAFYVISNTGPSWRFIKRDIGRSELEEIICTCRAGWEQDSSARGLGAAPAERPNTRSGPEKELSDLLLKDVIDPFKMAEALTVIPQDVICLVPFEALIEPRSLTALSELCQITYKPTLGQFAKQVPDIKSEINAVVAGVSTFDPSARSTIQFNDLPHVKTEVEKVAWTLGVEAVLNEACEKELLLEKIRSARIIHLATHGYSDPEDPLLSSLIMNDGTFLKAADLTQISLAADCVTLSACQTAVGLLSRGEGILGLAQAFLVAGAQTVIASLWQVDDESTYILFDQFYQLLNRGCSKSEALRKAKDHVRFYTATDQRGNPYHPFADPYYWAPFIMIGSQ